MNETKEQQKCIFCHGDPLPIMNMDDGDEADVWISGRTLKVSVCDPYGTYIINTDGVNINYCPMCGRKLS